MAKSKSGSKGLRQSKLVKSVVPDPDANPDVLAFEGLLGASAKEGYCRLYLNFEMSRYIEIREKDIAYSRQSSRRMPFELTAIWVHKSCQPKLVDIESDAVQTAFLKGPISARVLPGITKAGLERFAPHLRQRGAMAMCLITEWTVWNCSQDGHNTCKLTATEEWACDAERTAVFEEGDTVHITDAKICQPCTNVRCDAQPDAQEKA